MESKLRVVVKLPLDDLWDDCGPLSHTRVRWLSDKDIREMLRESPPQFVIADVGLPLQWIPRAESFRFWRKAVAEIAPPSQPASLNDYSGGCCYFAALWQAESAPDLIVLERHH